jgi:hypothetical protein
MQIIRLKFADAAEDIGALGEEGVPLQSPVAGHHIDILARATVDLSPLSGWVVTPVTPQHGFAGVAE